MARGRRLACSFRCHSSRWRCSSASSWLQLPSAPGLPGLLSSALDSCAEPSAGGVESSASVPELPVPGAWAAALADCLSSRSFCRTCGGQWGHPEVSWSVRQEGARR